MDWDWRWVEDLAEFRGAAWEHSVADLVTQWLVQAQKGSAESESQATAPREQKQ